MAASAALQALPAQASGEILAAAASPPGGPSSYIRAEDYRVAQVGHRLAAAGAGLCSDPHPLSGVFLHQLGDYDPSDRGDASAAYRLHLGAAVLTVLAGTPGARSGLIAGDVILAMNSIALPSPEHVAAERDKSGGKRTSLEVVEAHLESELRKGPVKLDLLRSSTRLSATLTSITGCSGRVRLARSSQPNAFADGRYAIVTTALLSFLRSDDEIAIVLAHEMAHNILRHPALLREQKVPRGLLRGIGKNAQRVWATEEEADRLSVKLLWAAGYDLAAVEPFWRRFYAKHDRAPQIFRTHPSLAERERIFAEAMAELPSKSAPP